MATLFVAGGTGFIGSEFVRRAVKLGHAVQVLARSPPSLEKARGLGAEPIEGDLAKPGPWQRVAAEAHWVAHLAQPQTFGGRVTSARARRYCADRLQWDRNLLDPLRPTVTRRILYVGGTSYYGDVGATLVDEDAKPQPRGWGPYVKPAIDALAGDLGRGLPIVQAFPGYVYGNGSWFAEYVLRPLRAGVKLTQIGGRPRVISPVHVADCARALLHLIERGRVGKRYFVVDDRPVGNDELLRVAAAHLDKPLRVRRVPPLIARLLLGPVVTDSLLSESALSNRRLKDTGFMFQFPTIEQGIAEVVG